MQELKITSITEYKEKYNESISNPDKFWSEIAEKFLWKRTWDTVLKWNFSEPDINWFQGGKLNITENIFERNLPHLAKSKALIWEPNETGNATKTYTYEELFHQVNKCANALRELGISKGDRICIYLPMVPELAISVLACARIGAVHSVVFAGFSANALSDRIEDAQAKMVITSDGMYRGNKVLDLKSVVDEALLTNTSVKNVLVLDVIHREISLKRQRDVLWNEIVSKQDTYCEAETMDSEDNLFILYTSGSTGKPKGVVHTCGGYMVYTAYSFMNVYQYTPGDIHWCTADIGWITGHSYILYGPLLCGATTLMFEGIPTYPNPSRFWDIIDKHNVNLFLTAPTAIRSLMAFGEKPIENNSLKSLKIIGTVGEPINEEAWHWYAKNIGKNNCPVVDNWWQTETGGIMISGLGNISPQKPTYAGYPLPGIEPVLLQQDGSEIKENNKEGYLCIKRPWPSILRTTFGNHQRCKETYFSPYEGYYFTGDGAKRDENGMYRIIGRIDDVINVSGHRFGTAEIENAINQNDHVIESAVVGYPHPIKGQSIYAFIVCEDKSPLTEETKKNISDTVSKEIGRIALPEKIQFVSGLPKTRSGKIMRRILRKVAEGEVENIGDTSTLLDPFVVEEIIKNRI